MKIYTKDELKVILDKHKEWLSDYTKGERAILSCADLSRANLSCADLSRANLSCADLSRANLSCANLSCADLSRANLSYANLYRANLSNSDLSRANLYNSNLSRADLSNSDLSCADLSNSDLSRADLSNSDLSCADLFRTDPSNTCINSFTLGKHFGYSWKNKNNNKVIVKIGCEEYSLEHWLKHGKEIGIKNEYTDGEIRLYLDMLKLLAKKSKKK